MAYSYEQPELHSDYIFVSSPRIFIRDYAASNLYSGQQILQVTSVGWYQMYTDFVDFSTVLPADIYGELTKARPQKV